jgi:hypothetical protein
VRASSQRKWAEFCVEYFAQRTEPKVNTNRFALAALKVNMNFVELMLTNLVPCVWTRFAKRINVRRYC